MKERPIIFNSEMVRAILDGRKTQTRRVIKLFKGNHSGSNVKCEGGKWLQYGAAGVWIDFPKCPHGKPGDVLWVRETWNNDWCDHPIYKADGGSAKEVGYASEPKWKSPRYMPKWATRIWLKVMGIRVERVQDISEGDAIKEGLEETIVEDNGTHYVWRCDNSGDTILISARDEFSNLWDSINKKRGFGWEMNPFVWVIEFERVDHDQTKEKTD